MDVVVLTVDQDGSRDAAPTRSRAALESLDAVATRLAVRAHRR